MSSAEKSGCAADRIGESKKLEEVKEVFSEARYIQAYTKRRAQKFTAEDLRVDKLLFTHPFYEFYYITKTRISFLMATLFTQRILACTRPFPLLTLTHFTPSFPNK